MKKLSEFQGAEAMSAVASLIEPVSRIAADERAGSLFRRERLPEGKTARAFLWNKIAASVPALLNDYRKEFCGVMAVVNETTPDKYAEDVTAAKLLSDVFGILNDEELFSLFFLAQPEA